jgi:molybdenum cofactor guanylyltransferase
MNLPFLIFPAYRMRSGLGALGGLYTALSASYPVAGVVACDMPFVNPDFWRLKRPSSQRKCRCGFALVWSMGMNLSRRLPAGNLFACGEEGIEAGKRRAIAWLPDVKVHAMNEDEVRRYDPQLLAFMNVNTPEEFRQAEELAASQEN